jgi:hypothetical protein
VADLAEQEPTHYVVQADRAVIEVEILQQREFVEFDKQIFGQDLVRIVTPEMRHDRNWNIRIFREDPKLAEASTLIRSQHEMHKHRRLSLELATD